jgi:hypothetical protein
MFKKFIENTKKAYKLFIIGMLIYAIVVSLATAICLDLNQTNFQKNTLAENLTDPFDDGYKIDDGESNQDDRSIPGDKIFDGQVYLMSNVERGTGYSLHLFAMPGQKSELYRDFSIYMFSNQKCNFLIKIDNQTYDRGEMTWFHRVDANSEYNKLDVTVILENTSQVSREYKFKSIQLLDSPWQTKKEKEEKEEETPDMVRPYLEMTQGDLNMFIVKRVIADIVSVIFGIMIGIQMAAVRADLRGIQRMF